MIHIMTSFTNISVAGDKKDSLDKLLECDECDAATDAATDNPDTDVSPPHPWMKSIQSFLGVDAPAYTTSSVVQSVAAEIAEFRLPISYLAPSSVFSLPPIVAADLELIGFADAKGMYDFFMTPSHSFAKDVLPSWQAQYTTDTAFLSDTQTILQTMNVYKKVMNEQSTKMTPELTQKITGIWCQLKKDSYFLEKYGYLEWDWEFAQSLNGSSSFLQFMSIMNIASPLFSLLLPVLMFVFPFLLLQFQGIPISFETYIETLQDIAKHHFIGKTLMGFNSLSFEKIIYMIFTCFLYLLQIYQNTNACIRFYRNMKTINDILVDLQTSCKYSLKSMETFADQIKNCQTYAPFAQVLAKHIETMREISKEIEKATPFSHSVDKIMDFGYMLKCFYALHKNTEYDACLRFSMGFEGYMDNLCGIHNHWVDGNIAMASWNGEPEMEEGETEVEEESSDEDTSTTQSSSKSKDETAAEDILVIKGQYYPPLVNESPVKNDCRFHKKMILSAPNKAGKTTLLKTTAINLLFTQQLGVGFYSKAYLKQPYTHFHSYLNIPDTSGRDSLFQAESRRCKEILDCIQENTAAEKYKHFCIFDELYSGTNPEEASKAGCAFLKYLARFPHVDFMLTTHYIDICRKFKHSSRIANYKMNVRVLENGTFEYTYEMKPGISNIKGAVRVLRDMDYPKEILEEID